MHFSLDDDGHLSRDQARRLQTALADQIVREDDHSAIRTVAGLHLSYPKSAAGVVTGRAGVVVLSFPELTVVEEHVATRPVTFPHVPGLTSFRGVPVALVALQRLQQRPDLLLVAGPGIAHPRRLGIASHLGVLLDLPTIGCAHSALVGQSTEPGQRPGDTTPLHDGDEDVGMAMRTRAGSRPVYVSTGHRVSAATACELVLRCSRGYRLPEPIRLAGRLAGRHGITAPEA